MNYNDNMAACYTWSRVIETFVAVVIFCNAVSF